MSTRTDRDAIRSWLDDDETCEQLSASGDEAKRKREELIKQLREEREKAEQEKKEREAAGTKEEADGDAAE
jgi:hypothetical protein